MANILSETYDYELSYTGKYINEFLGTNAIDTVDYYAELNDRNKVSDERITGYETEEKIGQEIIFPEHSKIFYVINDSEIDETTDEGVKSINYKRGFYKFDGYWEPSENTQDTNYTLVRKWKYIEEISDPDELIVGTATRYKTDTDGVSTLELGQSIINGGFDYFESTEENKLDNMIGAKGNMIGTKGWYVDAAWVEKEITDLYTPVRYMNDDLSPKPKTRLQIEGLLPHQITNEHIIYYFPKTYTNSDGTYTFITTNSSNTWSVTYENGTTNVLGNVRIENTNTWVGGSTEGNYYILNIPLYDSESPLKTVEYKYSNKTIDLNFGYTWYAYLHCANSYPKIFLPGVPEGVNYPPPATRVVQYVSREAFFNKFANETDHINIYDGETKTGLIDGLVGKAISYFPRFGASNAVAEWDETNKCVKWTSGVSIVTDSQGNKLLKANDVLKTQAQLALKLEPFKYVVKDKKTNKSYSVFGDYSSDSSNILRVSSLANTSYTWNYIPPSQYEVYQYFFSYINGLCDGTRYNIANATKNMPIVPQYFGEVDRGSPNGNCINIIDEPLVGGMDIYTDVYVFGLDANKTAGNSNMTVGKENQTYQSFGLAVGRKNYTIGYANFAAGRNNKVGGDQSAAIGDANTTLSSCSYAIGTSNIVGNTKSNKYGSFDIAIGKGLDLTNNDNAPGVGGRVAVGRYNKNESNSIFVVGNGTDVDNRSTAFEVTTSGLTKANNGLEITTGNLTISDGYLNMKVFAYDDDGNIESTNKYGEVKLVALDGEYTLNVVNVNTINRLAGATLNDNIEMTVYDKDGNTISDNYGNPIKAKLQCIQLGAGDNAQYSLRVFN